MPFMVIKLRLFKREFNIKYSALGALLLLLIIFVPSFAIGFNIAENTISVFLVNSAISYNTSAWELHRVGKDSAAEANMIMAVEFCTLYLAYDFQGHFDTGLYVRMIEGCEDIKSSGIELHNSIHPNDVIKITGVNGTSVLFNFSSCSVKKDYYGFKDFMVC